MIAFFRNLIFHDFWLKLLSMALAVLTWLIVWKVFLSKDVSPMAAFANKVEEQNYFNVPVTLLLSASALRPIEVEPSEVKVIVRAEPHTLESLKPHDIQAEVDLTGIEFTRGLRKHIDVNLPSGVTLIRVMPDEVNVIIQPPK